MGNRPLSLNTSAPRTAQPSLPEEAGESLHSASFACESRPASHACGEEGSGPDCAEGVAMDVLARAGNIPSAETVIRREFVDVTTSLSKDINQKAVEAASSAMSAALASTPGSMDAGDRFAIASKAAELAKHHAVSESKRTSFKHKDRPAARAGIKGAEADRLANCDALAEADQIGIAEANLDAHTDANSDANANADANLDANANADRNADVHANANADALGLAQADGLAIAQSQSEEIARAEGELMEIEAAANAEELPALEEPERIEPGEAEERGEIQDGLSGDPEGTGGGIADALAELLQGGMPGTPRGEASVLAERERESHDTVFRMVAGHELQLVKSGRGRHAKGRVPGESEEELEAEPEPARSDEGQEAEAPE